MDQKVLIVDAHPVYIQKMEGFLRGLTFNNVILAKSGQEGVRLAQTMRPDVILLSGMLPDMKSDDVCSDIKKYLPAVKIIVQTGLLTSPEEIRLLIQSGADVVLDRKEKDLIPLQKAFEVLAGSES